jgi:hypothetical protein
MCKPSWTKQTTPTYQETIAAASCLTVRRQQANLEVEIEGQWSLRSGGGEWGWTQASTSNKERTKKWKKT